MLYKTLPSNSFNKELTFSDAIYFSFITHTTVGYGDIVPVSDVARSLVILHSFLMFFNTVKWVQRNSMWNK